LTQLGARGRRGGNAAQKAGELSRRFNRIVPGGDQLVNARGIGGREHSFLRGAEFDGPLALASATVTAYAALLTKVAEQMLRQAAVMLRKIHDPPNALDIIGFALLKSLIERGDKGAHVGRYTQSSIALSKARDLQGEIALFLQIHQRGNDAFTRLTDVLTSSRYISAATMRSRG